jgi:predicted transcriptional regulator
MAMTVQLAEDLRLRVERLAARLGEDADHVVAMAVERFVSEELEFLDFVEEGVRDMEAGRTFSQDEVEAMLLSRKGARSAA